MRYVLTMFIAAACFMAVLAGGQCPAEAAPGPQERFGQALADYESGRFELAAAGAREAAVEFPGPPWEGRSLFLAGRAYAAAGQVTASEEAFRLAKKKYRVLSDYADFVLAGAYRDAGMNKEARALYLGVAERRPYGVLAEDCLLEAGRLLVDDGLHEEAANTLGKLMSRGPKRSVSAEALYLMAEAEAAKGDVEAVFGHSRKLWLSYPDFPFDRKAAELAKGMASEEKPVPEPDADDHIMRAEKLYRLGQYRRAASDYDKALAMLPGDSPKRGEALLGLGLCRYRYRDNGAAAAAFSELAGGGARYQDVAPEAYYWLVRTYLRTGQTEKFRAAALGCASEYPASSFSADCLFQLGVEYINSKMFDDAVEALGRVADGYPYYEDLPDATWRLGWALFMREDYDEAAGVFEKVYERYPSSSFAAPALYWRARSMESGGRFGESEALYRQLAEGYAISFYGLLAKGPGKPLKAHDPLKAAASPDTVMPEGPVTDDALKRAIELDMVGMREFGKRELRAAEGRYTSSEQRMETIAGAYYSLEEYGRPLELASWHYRTRMKTGRSPIPREMMRLIFPAGYWDFITRESDTFGVDPFLVASLVREESHFNPEAVSSAGAVGLMQLMPKTAAMVCRKLGRPDPTGEGLRQADYNLPLGVCHLGYLLEKHEGRLVYALAEYNAGPTALAKWKTRWPDVPDDVFVENISYPETRNYVKRILRNYFVYRELYASG